MFARRDPQVATRSCSPSSSPCLFPISISISIIHKYVTNANCQLATTGIEFLSIVEKIRQRLSSFYRLGSGSCSGSCCSEDVAPYYGWVNNKFHSLTRSHNELAESFEQTRSRAEQAQIKHSIQHFFLSRLAGWALFTQSFGCTAPGLDVPWNSKCSDFNRINLRLTFTPHSYYIYIDR